MKFEIYTPGSTVSVNKMVIEGVVREVTISEGLQVKYNVGYWSKDSYITNWFMESEVSGVEKVEVSRIGF